MSHTTDLAAGNFLIPDGTFVAELAVFIIVLAAISRLVVPPLKASMEKRQEAIRQQIEDARLAKERLDAAEADYQKALSEARAEAARTREDAQATRKAMIDAAKDEARIEAEAVTRRAEERIALERAQVLAELRREIGELALTLSERIVGETLADDERQRRVVERFLSELESSDQGTTQTPTAAH